jgi:NAD-dependent SIR2 family protein deacetylase
MPKCQNCGSSVTEAYVRVFAPDGMENPRVCPFCEDKVRDGADVREARSVRH